MAACGASDSVIAQTPVSPRSRGSLFFSSLFLLHGGGVLLDRLMLLLSAQYHTLCITSVTGGLPRSRHTGPTRRNENGKKWKKRSPSGISLSISVESVGVDDESAEREREGTFHIHQSCTHIYLIYISTHPAVLFWKRKRQFCKTRTCGGLIAYFFFPFSALYGVCQTQWT